MKEKSTIFFVSLFVSVMLFSGCAEKKAVIVTTTPAYNWTRPDGPNYAKGRIADIREKVKEISNDRVKSLYWMEAGLIYEKVLKMDEDSLYCYEQAVESDPANCDARMLLSSVLSRKRRVEKSVIEAQGILKSMKDCGKGTVLTFNQAKLEILTGDPQAVKRGREKLEGLSTYNLGQSGVTKEEIINLLIYSYLKAKDFKAAAKRFEESPGIKIIPKLGVLMYMGNLDFDRMKSFNAEEKGRIKKFLLKGDPSDYFPPTTMENLVLASPEKEGTRDQAPDPSEGMTKFEREIYIDTWGEDKKLMDFWLEKRTEQVEKIKKAQGNLKEAKIYLLTTELNHYLLGTPRPGDAYQNYVKAHTTLRNTILSLSEPLQKILSTGNPKELLKNPNVVLEDSELLGEFMETEGTPSSDKELVSDLFRSFAYKKVESLRAIDFFLPFTVRMEDLRSRDVRDNIIRLQKVIAGEPVSTPLRKQ